VRLTPHAVEAADPSITSNEVHMIWYLLIREPDVHHNHWGLRLIRGDKCPPDMLAQALVTLEFDHEDECFWFCQWLMDETKIRSWNPFHQGGHHLLHERCTGHYHYIEFWGLSGDDPDGRQAIISWLEREFPDSKPPQILTPEPHSS
jgi:hypothetical protein